jgi:hypothetical protein
MQKLNQLSKISQKRKALDGFTGELYQTFKEYNTNPPQSLSRNRKDFLLTP